MEKSKAYPQEFARYKSQRLREECFSDLYILDEGTLSRYAAPAPYRLDSVWRQPASAHLYIDPTGYSLPAYPPLEELLACCPIAPRDKQILALYFGDSRTQSDIGRIFGITPERVRQIIQRASKEIKNFFTSKIKCLDKLTPLRWRYRVKELVESQAAKQNGRLKGTK